MIFSSVWSQTESTNIQINTNFCDLISSMQMGCLLTATIGFLLLVCSDGYMTCTSLDIYIGSLMGKVLSVCVVTRNQAPTRSFAIIKHLPFVNGPVLRLRLCVQGRSKGWSSLLHFNSVCKQIAAAPWHCVNGNTLFQDCWAQRHKAQ
jgi:hypothetical protein